MLAVKGKVEQPAADGPITFDIETKLGVVDQKTLWELVGLEVQWDSSFTLSPVVNYVMTVVITRKPDKTDFLDGEVIGSISWSGNQGNATATNGAIPVEMIKRYDFIDRPQVANSHIFIVLQSGNTKLKNIAKFKLYYEEKKVSELEFIKAQSGYCVC
jgi:hypothetical protein